MRSLTDAQRSRNTPVDTVVPIPKYVVAVKIQHPRNENSLTVTAGSNASLLISRLAIISNYVSLLARKQLICKVSEQPEFHKMQIDSRVTQWTTVNIRRKGVWTRRECDLLRVWFTHASSNETSSHITGPHTWYWRDHRDCPLEAWPQDKSDGWKRGLPRS